MSLGTQLAAAPVRSARASHVLRRTTAWTRTLAVVVSGVIVLTTGVVMVYVSWVGEVP